MVRGGAALQRGMRCRPRLAGRHHAAPAAPRSQGAPAQVDALASWTRREDPTRDPAAITQIAMITAAATRLVGLPSAAIAAARCSAMTSGGMSFMASMIPSGRTNQLVQIA
jgi:hypothetical protein